MPDTQHADDPDQGFTLDEATLVQRRAGAAQQLNQQQIPILRSIGFVVLCAMLALQGLQADPARPPGGYGWLIALNLAYAALAWPLLRFGYGRTRLDLPFWLFHADVLVWLVDLSALEHANLFFAYLLLVRVVDQVGFGFRRAVYFAHVVTLAYIGFAVWDAAWGSQAVTALQRAGIAATMYLLGWYLSATGLVTERLRRRLQQAMRTGRASLAALEQRGDELREQAVELERARNEAERASRAKSQFLAVVSHEIRTPMNGILGATELLQETPMSTVQQRYVTTVHRSAVGLLHLIDDVLDMARLEAGRMQLTTADFELPALLTEAVELVALAARNRPVTLECRLASDLPARVRGDPHRLRQVLLNLLHNAVKFTDHGGVVLDASVKSSRTNGVTLHVSVHDTGIGISNDQLESIFDVFAQADGSSTRRHGGSGLGLAIAKDLTTLMGGRLGVESRLGQGSHFWIELPLQRAAEAPPPTTHDEAAGGSMRVLLAEDDEVNQLVIGDMLRLLGCSVDVANNGAQAREAAARGAYDIILMDCHMPEMDGYDAARAIRADEDRLGVRRPIVALTADVLAGNRERCLECGMDDVVNKPITRASLAAALSRWTGRPIEAATRF